MSLVVEVSARSPPARRPPPSRRPPAALLASSWQSRGTRTNFQIFLRLFLTLHAKASTNIGCIGSTIDTWFRPSIMIKRRQRHPQNSKRSRQSFKFYFNCTDGWYKAVILCGNCLDKRNAFNWIFFHIKCYACSVSIAESRTPCLCCGFGGGSRYPAPEVEENPNWVSNFHALVKLRRVVPSGVRCVLERKHGTIANWIHLLNV